MVRSIMFSLLLSACAHAEPRLACTPPTFAEHVIDVGDFTADALGPVQRKFEELAAGGAARITFRISSYGGELETGFDFIRHLEDTKKAHNGVSVQCVVDVRAMSMGFAFLQSPVCDERYMTRRSVLLTHQPWAGDLKGTAGDLENAAQRLRASAEAFAAMASARLTISRSDYEAHVLRGNWTMGADEAASVGAVDAFVAPESIPTPYDLEAAENPAAALLKRLLRQ